MLKVELPALFERLNDFSKHALEEASSLCISQGSNEVSVSHFLYKTLDNPYSDIRTILDAAGFDADRLREAFSQSFQVSNDISSGAMPAFSPLLIECFQEAWMFGSLEKSENQIRTGAILLSSLMDPARYLPLNVIKLLDAINRETLRKEFSNVLKSSGESQSTSTSKNATNNTSVSEGDTPLDKYATNFTALATQGKIDPVLSRDNEIDMMVDILLRRRKNNPIVVGEAGVGKSALIEGLALRIIEEKVPESLREVQLWGLDLGALQSGASVKGEFEKRLKQVIDQATSASPPVILFIDEAHTLIGAGNNQGGSDAANLLKPALARGALRTIAATTWSEYKKYFEKDPALTRRFQLINLKEPTVEQAVHILRGLRDTYEEAHQVYITDKGLEASAALSARYVAGRQLPDKAIDVLDTACARVASGLESPPQKLTALENKLIETQRQIDAMTRDQSIGEEINADTLASLEQMLAETSEQKTVLESAWEKQKDLVHQLIEKRHHLMDEAPPQTDLVDQDADNLIAQIDSLKSELLTLQKDNALMHAEVDIPQIAAVISNWTGVPMHTISGDDVERIIELKTPLFERIKGQNQAIETVHKHLLTSAADLRRDGTPLGAFLLVGPSGVGKTELATQIAIEMFGGKGFLTTINMSEYQEKHTLSRLIGSPPGYVGFGEGGVLSEAIRQKPYSVVLLDEVEKAHPDVLNLFYQAFDKGEFADGEGRLIDCQNIVFFLTSNLGFDSIQFNVEPPSDDELNAALYDFFKPALLARMQVVRFNFLDESVMSQIIDGRLNKLQVQFFDKYSANLEFSAEVIDDLRAACLKPQNGARVLDGHIDGQLIPPLSLAVLKKMGQGETISNARLSFENDVYIATFD